MSRPTAEQQAFASGKAGLLHKFEVKPTAFEIQCKRLGVGPEDTKAQLRSPELRSWVKQHKDSRYVPTVLLSRLDMRTIYDGGDQTPYSFADGTTVPEQQPSVEDLTEAA